MRAGTLPWASELPAASVFCIFVIRPRLRSKGLTDQECRQLSVWSSVFFMILYEDWRKGKEQEAQHISEFFDSGSMLQRGCVSGDNGVPCDISVRLLCYSETFASLFDLSTLRCGMMWLFHAMPLEFDVADAGRSVILPLSQADLPAKMGGWIAYHSLQLQHCWLATRVATWKAKGGFLQLSLGDVRDKWGEEAWFYPGANHVKTCESNDQCRNCSKDLSCKELL